MAEKYTREYFVECGKRSTGGKKMREKGSKYFSDIGKKGAMKRWKRPVDNSIDSHPPCATI